MAKGTAVNAANLKALGPDRLAELLMGFAEKDASAKRKLRLELMAMKDPAALAKEVRKRLNTIGRSRSWVDWDKQKAFAADLETQRATIADKIAKHDAAAALNLMWQFMELAPNVFGRSDDSYGSLGSIFGQACKDLGHLADCANPLAGPLAERVLNAIIGNDYGEFDDVVTVLSQALGREGLKTLKSRINDILKNSPAIVPTRGSYDPERTREEIRQRALRRALMDIADAEGDVDAFIAQFDKTGRENPLFAAEIASRLLAAKRAEEAFVFINQARHPDSGFGAQEWLTAKLKVLEALGRTDEAQDLRLEAFRKHLIAGHLRDYLKRLPDFDDIEAENRLLDGVLSHKEPLAALAFFTAWPDAKRAARLVLDRGKPWDGEAYYVLTPAAKLLEPAHPLAATLLLRSMIVFALDEGRSSRYRHAARHLKQCESLAAEIGCFEGVSDHQTFTKKLLALHGRKSSFWSLVKA